MSILMGKKAKNCSCEVVDGSKIAGVVAGAGEGQGGGARGVSRPISFDCVALLNMLSILSEIDGIGRRACVTGGGGRKDSVTKTPSGMPCKKSTISMPSSLLGETKNCRWCWRWCCS